MVHNPNLPQEILVEIFSKLPAKSVGKCRCLSKTWNTYLSTSQFINLHLNRKTHQQNLILVSRRKSLEVITSPTKNDQALREIKLPNNWSGFGGSYVIGSCNGLVLLSCQNQKLLLNPITHQQVMVINSGLCFRRQEGFCCYGFGYDHSCDDYKVCTIYRDRYEPHKDVIDVYSVRQGVCKRVGYSPFNRLEPGRPVMPFINDCVHWFSTIESGIRIGAFDLVNETFQVVPLPKEFQLNSSKLMIFGGCLSIVDYSIPGYRFIDVWIMKEHGVVDSWVRFRINGKNRWTAFRPVCFVGDEELLAFTGEGSWSVCDLKADSVKEVVGDWGSSSNTRDWNSFIVCGSFVGTLVSPERKADA